VLPFMPGPYDPTDPASPNYDPTLYPYLGQQPPPAPPLAGGQAPQGPLAAALLRLQQAQGPAGPAPAAGGPPPLTPQDLMGPAPPRVDIPQPPQYPQSFGDLPDEQQHQANAEAMARMGVAFGAARPGGLGEAMAQAALGRSLTQDAAVDRYQKQQDLQYQRDLLASEQQSKAAAVSATQLREQQQATQRASLANSIAQRLGPNDSQAQMARMYALAGDDKGLQGIADAMPTRLSMKQRGVNVDDPIAIKDWTDQHAAELSRGDKVALENALAGPQAQAAALKAAAEGQATLPTKQAMARYEAGLTFGREQAMAKVNDSLIRGRSLDEAMAQLSKAEQLAVFNHQLSQAAASQPLTGTEAAKAMQGQIHETYQAMKDDAKLEKITFEGKEMLPSAALKIITDRLAQSGPALPPGVKVQPPGAVPFPTPLAMPTLGARVGTPAGAAVGPAGPPGPLNLANVGTGKAPALDAGKLGAVKQALPALGEAGVRAKLAAAGVPAAQIDAYIAGAKQ